MPSSDGGVASSLPMTRTDTSGVSSVSDSVTAAGYPDKKHQEGYTTAGPTRTKGPTSPLPLCPITT
jgi:hypothetical protein